MYSFFRTHERNYIPNSSRPVLKLAFSKTPYKLYLTMRSTPFISLPHILLIASILFSSFCATAFANNVIPDDGKLRIIVFGAHPDDAELEAGGTAALWASMGHHVKFVSTTNGDIGHAVQAGALHFDPHEGRAKDVGFGCHWGIVLSGDPESCRSHIAIAPHSNQIGTIVPNVPSRRRHDQQSSLKLRPVRR